MCMPEARKGVWQRHSSGKSGQRELCARRRAAVGEAGGSGDPGCMVRGSPGGIEAPRKADLSPRAFSLLESM